MILQMDSSKSGMADIEKLGSSLYPVCKYDPEHSDVYRGRDYLIRLISDAVPSLKEFYRDRENGAER